jgi:hypothetical protein
VNELFSTFHFVELESDADENRRAAAKENTSRNAQVEITHIQTGIGQKRVAEALIFPVIFKTEPHFTCGSGVISNPNADIWHDPRGSSGIYSWKRDGRGNYIGARIWVRLDMERKAGAASKSPADTALKHLNQQRAIEAKVKVEHFLTFSAIAFKDLPNKTLSRALTPRTVGY